MELWTLIKNNEYIRFNVIHTDDEEFGIKFYFTDSEYDPIWVINSEEKAINALKEFVHPFDSMDYWKPSTEYINIKEYEIKKLTGN